MFLRIIARYQRNHGGRPSLADPNGSYSQRIAYIAVMRGQLLALALFLHGAARYYSPGSTGHWDNPDNQWGL